MSTFLTLRLKRFVPIGLLALVAAVLLAPAAANATPYVVRIVQQGSNVIASGSGEFDLTGLTFDSVYSTSEAGIGPNVAGLYSGSSNSPAGVSSYAGVTGPTSFGSGCCTYTPNSTGDAVYIYEAIQFFAVPFGYQSGSPLSNTTIWNNATFASLGVTPGTYVWTWGTGADQSFTLMIGSAVGVPEPAALGIFGFGVLLVGGFICLRRRAA